MSDVSRVEANARLTAATGVVLIALLGAEGLTIVAIHRLLTWHEAIGIALVPPVMLKLATTGYRFIRYYSGDPAFRLKGPPPLVLRLLGPLVVLLTAAVIGSGLALLPARGSWQSEFLFLHKASFVLWFGAMTIHVLGHLRETAEFGARDWYGHFRKDVAGAGRRQWTLAASLAAGLSTAIVTAPHLHGFIR